MSRAAVRRQRPNPDCPSPMHGAVSSGTSWAPKEYHGGEEACSYPTLSVYGPESPYPLKTKVWTRYIVYASFSVLTQKMRGVKSNDLFTLPALTNILRLRPIDIHTQTFSGWGWGRYRGGENGKWQRTGGEAEIQAVGLGGTEGQWVPVRSHCLRSAMNIRKPDPICPQQFPCPSLTVATSLVLADMNLFFLLLLTVV